MSNTPKITREDSLKERALQILNLQYVIESDIKTSYRKRIFEYHPDQYPEAKENSDKLLEYENKIKVINQSYELLLDVLNGVQINISKYSLLEDNGLDSGVSLHFGSAPYFAFMDVEEGQIVSYYSKVNEGAKLAHKKGVQVAHLLVEENVDVVLATSVGESPFHVLRDSIVRIYHLSGSVDIREAIRLLNQNLLKIMETPTEKDEIDGNE
jgi:predicted Fe-Mo cluster-binding NifX family protein